MAEAQLFVSQDEITCSVCLETLTDPVTIPCGHSFCLKCLTDCWYQIIRKLKKMALSSLPSKKYASSGDVECDFCIGKKFRAVKSCLTCMASFCQTHLQHHYKIAAWKGHKLTDPEGNLEEKLCAKHQKSLEMFCKTDKTCICMMCGLTEHNGHEKVELETERQEQQVRLGEGLCLPWTMRGQPPWFVWGPRDLSMEGQPYRGLWPLPGSTWTSKEPWTSALPPHPEELTEEIPGTPGMLPGAHAALPPHQEVPQEAHQGAPGAHPGGNKRGRLPPVVSQSREEEHEAQRRGVEVVKEGWIIERPGASCINGAYAQKLLCSAPSPVTHSQISSLVFFSLLSDFCPLTLDINTAHRRLHLSEGNKKVTCKRTKPEYPDHPDRFDDLYEVLCREALTGTRCYWEVECTGVFIVIGVTYKGLGRKGKGMECSLGDNEKSWSLLCFNSKYSVHHNNKQTTISAPYSPKVGVYLDWPAGLLSFYSVSHTMTLLHRFSTSFTEPLYPGFGLGWDSSVTIYHLTPGDH
uniref:Tripartite motif-containing protein 16-like n=1 Tax=Erpetoichthys calabaricus TaxID=27687 RepID=A0A8C4TFZ4_ERPCA